MSFNKNTSQLVIFLVVIFTFLFSIFHAWIIPKGAITYGDALYFYPSLFLSWFHNLSFSWVTYIDLGSNSAYNLNQFFPSYILGVFALFGMGYSISERIVFFIPLIIISVLGFLLLFKRLFKTDNYFILGIPILLFIFNPSSYFFFKWPKIALAYAAIPLALWSFIKFLDKRNSMWMYIFTLLFFTTFLDMRMGFFAAIFILFYFLAKLLGGYSLSKSLLKQFVCIVIIFLLLSSFFLLPLVIKTNQVVIGAVTDRGAFGLDFYNLAYALTTFHPFWTGSTIEIFTVHPIEFFYWFLPLYAFAALLYAKKNKTIIYFTAVALVGIFFGKGADKPLAGAFEWFYEHIIFFDFSRDPSRWYVLIVIAYVVLIGYFLYYTFLYFDKLKNTFLRFISKTLVIIPLAVIIISVAAPTFNGTTGWIFTAYTIPQEYVSLNKLLTQNKQFARTFNFPDIQRYTLMDNTHPAVSFMDLTSDMQTLNTKMLNLMSIQYIIMPDDPLQDLYKWFGPQKEFSNYINQNIQNNSWLEKKVGNITIWQNNKGPLPHIMPVTDLVYVTGEPALKDIISLPTGGEYAYFFEQPVIGENDDVLNNSTQIDAAANCIFCDPNSNYVSGVIIYPFAHILPDSSLYSFVQGKEDSSLASASPDDRAKLAAFYVTKRAVELQDLVEKKADQVYVSNVEQRLINQLQIVQNYLASVPTDRSENVTNPVLNYLHDYLFAEVSILQGINTQAYPDVTPLLQTASYQSAEVLDTVEKRAWISEGNSMRYAVTTPVSGQYTVFVKNDNGINFKKSSLSVNDTPLSQKNVTNGFINYGSIALTKGTFPVAMNAQPINLISTNSAKITIPDNRYASSITLPINKLSEPLATYQVAFDYMTSVGLSTTVSVFDDFDSVINNNALLSDTVTNAVAGKWTHFTSTFNTPYGISHPQLSIDIYKVGEGTSQLLVKNMSVTKESPPVIVLNKQKVKTTVPSITFKENTPVDYTVMVHNATGPFVLSFSEGFDPGWRMSIDDKSQLDNGSATNTYLSNVKEIIASNFANPFAIFRYVFGPQVPKSEHVELNSFGNGWIVSKKGNYTLHLYFFPQVLFLIGLLISTATAIVVIYLLVRAFLKRTL